MGVIHRGGSQLWTILYSWNILHCLETFLNVTFGAKYATSFLGKAKDAAKYPTTYRAAPKTKNCLAKNVNSAEAEKPDILTMM